MGHNWVGILQPQDTTKPAQPGGCSQCHTGNGNKPNPVDALTQADFDSIDCLLCHGPNYSRVVAKEGDTFKQVPAPTVNAVASAQNAQSPTSEMCLRCHAGTGGGPNAKHGVIPTKDTDVHMAAGLNCVDCHTYSEHRIGGGSDVKVQELTDQKVDCSNCHTATPHKGSSAARLNDHATLITCQTCHIPAIARDPKAPTVVNRDWTKPVPLPNGLFGPTNVWVNDVTPEYHWWNRTMKTPPEPVGSRGDGKISPWKRADYTVMADQKSGEIIYMKAGVYSVTGDVSAAVKKGAEDAKQQYSGAWKPTTETMTFSLNHQVAPSSQALSCADCHVPDGRLNFAALGYNEAEVALLSSIAAPAPQPAAAAPSAPMPASLPAAGSPGMAALPLGALAGALLTAAGLWARRKKS